MDTTYLAGYFSAYQLLNGYYVLEMYLKISGEKNGMLLSENM
jgi:hypothetical protein